MCESWKVYLLLLLIFSAFMQEATTAEFCNFFFGRFLSFFPPAAQKLVIQQISLLLYPASQIVFHFAIWPFFNSKVVTACKEHCIFRFIETPNAFKCFKKLTGTFFLFNNIFHQWPFWLVLFSTPNILRKEEIGKTRFCYLNHQSCNHIPTRFLTNL